MRYLFLHLCEQPGGRFPLYIELRKLNDYKRDEFVDFILNELIVPGATITKEQFEDGLKSGAFTLIFDGFDEVDFDRRKWTEDEITKMLDRFPQIFIIISSRPDERFGSWSRFYISKLQPMNKRQSVSLVKKLDFDVGTKSRFLKALKAGQFEKHASFLSNPLLCIMMLITFEQYANIPDKIHIFYEHAFEALFSRHDASKHGAYVRKRYCKLAIDEFRNCLSAFCITTYAKSKYIFTHKELRAFVRRAIAFEKLRVPVDEYIADLMESVCILQRDGLYFTFTHRSFQEYFAAYFVSRSPSIEIAHLLDQLAPKRSDGVIAMAFDMNRNFIERELVLPKSKTLIWMLRDISPNKGIIEFVDKVYGGLSMHLQGERRGIFYYNLHNSNGYILMTILDLYQAHFRGIVKWAAIEQRKI